MSLVLAVNREQPSAAELQYMFCTKIFVALGTKPHVADDGELLADELRHPEICAHTVKRGSADYSRRQQALQCVADCILAASLVTEQHEHLLLGYVTR